MKKVIIITSDEIRHRYFKIIFAASKGIHVMKTYCEIDGDIKLFPIEYNKKLVDNVEKSHYIGRHNTEHDFFSDAINYIEDKSNSYYIKRKEINNQNIIHEIKKMSPDLIITYGCSIIKLPLIEAFKNKIINVHLGLSPYYFGSSTNFHALVNKDFQCVGYTFMYMDEGIDTGEIIHQKRVTVYLHDNPHQIGNRLIKNMAHDFVKLVQNFESIKKKTKVTDFLGKTYKSKDDTLERVILLYDNFKNNACREYILKRSMLEAEYPIIEQSFL